MSDKYSHNLSAIGPNTPMYTRRVHVPNNLLIVLVLGKYMIIEYMDP